MKCKQCGKEKLSLSELELCDICDYTIKRNTTILEESTDILNKTKNIQTFMNRCKVTLRALENLEKFDHLNYMEPSASQLIADVLEKRRDTIFEYWENHCMSLSQKLKSNKSMDNIVNTIEKTKEELIKYEEYFQNPERIESIKLWIESFSDEHITGRYNNLISIAKDYEKRGDNKIAIKKLNEALKIFEKYSIYFGEGNQSLDIELKEWIERLEC